MNHADKICKEVLNLVSFSNDRLQRLIVEENLKNTISLSENDVKTLLVLVKSSLTESYQAVFNSLYDKINLEIDQASSRNKNKK